MFESGSTVSYLSRTGSPIVGIASALGGPVVILRISGMGLESFSRYFSKWPATGTFILSDIVDPADQSIVDRALVLNFKSPHSFTGEDVVEIHCHGVGSIVQKVCKLFLRNGALSALPGEFSFRAVRNGKMTLQQAESLNLSMSGDAVVHDDARELLNLPRSATEFFAKELSHCIDSCVRARARVEAAIDFSEAAAEQAQDVQAAEILVQIAIDKLRVFADRYERFANAALEPKIAIVGEPNAGKSSLLNLLAGGNRVLVSKIAGTTRDVIDLRLRLPSGRRVTILDTAGIHSSDSDLEMAGIELGLEAARGSDALIWVRPAHKKESVSSVAVIEKLLAGRKVCVLYSHIDLVDDRERSKFNRAFDLSKPSRRNEEIFLLIEELLDLNGSQTTTNISNTLIVSRRQRELMRLVEVELEDALFAIRGTRPLELCGENLKHAEGLLKKCIGQEMGDAAIQAIFEQFCLGK